MEFYMRIMANWLRHCPCANRCVWLKTIGTGEPARKVQLYALSQGNPAAAKMALATKVASALCPRNVCVLSLQR